jgi:two-component system sensor histidine kinase EvgS
MTGNGKRDEQLLNQCGFFAGKVVKKHFLKGQVILVDDCRLQHHALSQLLAEFGLNTKCTNSVDEALQYIISSHNIGLLISDIELSGESGFDLIKAINSSHHHRSIPSIAISSNQKYRSSALAAGFDAFLAKPVSKQDLINTLSKFNLNESIQFYEEGENNHAYISAQDRRSHYG